MATGKGEKKRGRPRKGEEKLDPFRPVGTNGRPRSLVPDDATLKRLVRYGERHCTYETMASYFDVSLTAFNSFRKEWPEVDEAIAKGKARLEFGIRDAQIRLGIGKLNGDMLKWLGKNYLGQAEKIEQKNLGDIAIHIDADDANM